MTPQQLKNSILQMAMQGKLVEQRPEEGTGEELYQQIQKEKQKLIKEGKIKKEKPLPEITEDEMPFEIPESWKWVRWGEVINVVSARRVHQSDWKTTGIPFYRAREIAKLAENGNVDNELFISQQLFDEFSKFGVPHPGDLMVTAVGTLGRTYIVQPEDHFYYKDASVLCFENFADINAQYLKVAMDSELMGAQIKSNSGGTTVSTLTIVRMNDYLLPLPPLAEQKRIVAKIEEIMPYIDRYAVAYDHLQSYNTRFPDDLKKSILQMAIQGKLVPQDPNDEPASVLLEKIAKEKQKLIKEGKIKKQKPLPEITEDEIPFEIPESWRWVHIGDLFEHNTGKALNSKDHTGAMYSYITTSNVYWNSFRLDNLSEMPFSKQQLEKCTVEKGDLLVLEGGAYYGRAAIWPYEWETRIQNHIHRLRSYGSLNHTYFYYIFYFYRNSGMISSKGTAMPGLSSGALDKLIVPLPPLAEQKRIVAKLDELLPQIDSLK